jgi:hypothetical protein
MPCKRSQLIVKAIIGLIYGACHMHHCQIQELLPFSIACCFPKMLIFFMEYPIPAILLLSNATSPTWACASFWFEHFFFLFCWCSLRLVPLPSFFFTFTNRFTHHWPILPLLRIRHQTNLKNLLSLDLVFSIDELIMCFRCPLIVTGRLLPLILFRWLFFVFCEA